MHMAPLERYFVGHDPRHKALTDWAHQIIRQVSRRLLERVLIAALDST